MTPRDSQWVTGSEWITGKEAAEIVSANNDGRLVEQKYIRTLAYQVKPPKIRVRMASDAERYPNRRTALYNREDVEKIRMRKRKTRAEIEAERTPES